MSASGRRLAFALTTVVAVVLILVALHWLIGGPSPAASMPASTSTRPGPGDRSSADAAVRLAPRALDPPRPEPAVAPSAASDAARPLASDPSPTATLAVRLRASCDAMSPVRFVLRRLDRTDGSDADARMVGPDGRTTVWVQEGNERVMMPGPVVEPEADRLAWVHDAVRFTGLAPGRYRLEAGGDGWSTVHREWTLSAGDAPPEEEIRLEPIAASQLRGTVRAARTGAPIDTFRVRVFGRTRHPDGVLETRIVGSRRVSSPAGEFCLAGIDFWGERARVEVSADGYEPGDTGWRPIGAESDWTALVFALSRVEEVFAAVEGVALSIATNEPLGGVEVRVLPEAAASTPLLALGGALSKTPTFEIPGGTTVTATGDDGGFHLDVPVGRDFRVAAYRPDHVFWMSPPLLASAAGDVLWQIVPMDPGARIHGTVVVADEILAEVDLASVRIERSTPPAPGGGENLRVREVPIDDERAYTSSGLLPGVYEVTLRGTGTDPSTPMNLVLASESVALGVGESRRVDLYAGAGWTGAAVDGRVLLPAGARFDAVVAALVEPGASDVPPRRGILVGDDGWFRLTDVADGEYHVAIIGASADRSSIAAAVEPVVVADETASPSLVVFDLTRPSLQGELLDDGVRAAGVELALRFATDDGEPRLADAFSAGLVVETDNDGGFVVYGLPPGTVLEPSVVGEDVRPARVALPAGVSRVTLRM